MGITYHKYKIPIYKREINVWENELYDTNIKTLKYIDEDFFLGLEKTLEREKLDNKYVYYSIFQNYYSSLEVMFSHLCAVLQSPHFYYPWIMSYKNEELIKMVSLICSNGSIQNAHSIDNVSWLEIAKIIHPVEGYEAINKNIILFPKIWEKLSRDFLNSDFIEAYNSLKHGMRVSDDAIKHLQIGDTLIKGSDYGIEYCVLRNNQGIDVLKRKTVNINTKIFDYAFDLIRGTMINVKSYLKIISSNKDTTVSYFELNENIVNDFLNIEPSSLLSLTQSL